MRPEKAPAGKRKRKGRSPSSSSTPVRKACLDSPRKAAAFLQEEKRLKQEDREQKQREELASVAREVVGDFRTADFITQALGKGAASSTGPPDAAADAPAPAGAAPPTSGDGAGSGSKEAWPWRLPPGADAPRRDRRSGRLPRDGGHRLRIGTRTEEGAPLTALLGYQAQAVRS